MVFKVFSNLTINCQLLWCRAVTVVQDSYCGAGQQRGAGQLLWCRTATVVQGSYCGAGQLLQVKATVVHESYCGA